MNANGRMISLALVVLLAIGVAGFVLWQKSGQTRRQ
jgi:hypothetical protein